jgi:hypothetical protein
MTNASQFVNVFNIYVLNLSMTSKQVSLMKNQLINSDFNL